jgi:hypothetical protein
MRLIFVAATVKILVGLASSFWTSGGQGLPPSALPSWYYVGLLLVFGASGTLLCLGGRDVRARWLGLVFLTFGSLFTDRLVARTLPGMPEALGVSAAGLADLHLTALVPFTFWRFAWTFPRIQAALLPAWAPRAMTTLTLGAGSVLLLGALLVDESGRHPFAIPALGAWLSPNSESGWFWQTCSVLVLPSLVLLVAKLGTAGPEERRRLGWVVGGIVVGSAPMLVHVLLVTTSARYETFVSDPERMRMTGIALSAFSLVIPATAAYAVLVSHVLEVRFVIHRAVQYGLARYTVIALMAGLAGGIVAVGYTNRDRPLRELLGASPWPAAALALAAAVLLGRRSLLDAIDRRFFREHYDARRILVELVDKSRRAATAHDIVTLIVGEVDRALHLERVFLLVRDEGGDRLRDPEGRLSGLDVEGALAALIGGSHAPLDVDLSSDASPLGRLPDGEREWLADSGARLVVPLLGTKGRPLGVLALGDKRSGQPFTAEDRELMTLVAAAAAVALERKLQSESPDPDPPRGVWSQPAGQCVTCGRVQDRTRNACHACGSALREALLPVVLAGKFEIERQIGAGGMGVVYRAHDLELGRPVAMKVLPRVAPEATARLRREARAMAAMHHHHLAVVHAMESWRGTPVLVLEYLAGGTVADRIRQGPLPVADAVGLGRVVADVLHHVHRAGYLHRDVKPSNIGYTDAGVAKLLDFGLVRLFSALTTRSAVAREPGEDAVWEKLVSSSDSTAPGLQTATQKIVGTPAYLPPEAIAMSAPTQAIDLWGLAVTLYEAITQKNPFLAPTLGETVRLIERAAVPDARTLRPDCPGPLAAFLSSALSADPRLRPQTALEFQSRLVAAAEEARAS